MAERRQRGPAPSRRLPPCAGTPCTGAEGPWACRVGSWLFLQGGMSAILLLGLMAFGLIGAFLSY